MKHTNIKLGIPGTCLLLCALASALAGVAAAQAFGTTTVQGTVYLANGAPGSGTLQLSWPAFTTAANQAVAAGRTTVPIGSDGFVSVNLAPNVGSMPAGLYYTAVYHLSDGTTSTEYWVVPAAAEAALAQVRATLMPAAQAVQAVNKAYVDQSIAELVQSQVTSSGGNMTGPLYLNGDPATPTQAATKHYVDNQFSQALSINGGAATGPLTATQLGAAYQADQFQGADFGAKLQACINALNSTYGGSCDARNFSGTLSMGSNVTISNANVTINLPCATIATGSQIIVTAGTRNVTLHGCASRGTTAASGNQGGTVFLYSGSAAMIQVGDSTYASDTLGFHLDNAVLNTTPSASAAAQALTVWRAQELHLEGLYLLGNANQIGITLDGTGNYTGGTFDDVEIGGFQTAVNAVGHKVANSATTDWVNASTFVRLHIDCPTSNGSAIAGTTGINLAQGDGNTFTGGDVEGCATALHLGANAQNNTIVGLRNENSTYQVVADTGSAYNNWMTGGTMFTGKLTDKGTRNSFLDTFHRSFNALNGDWFGSQQDATLTNHYRLGIGSGNERGLLHRYQTDSGYRWTMGLSDATAGEQYYQVLDELNNVYRLSIGQYNTGQGSSNNQTVINAAGTGAVILNGSNNSGSGGVVFGSGGPSSATVATINNAGNAQFTGTLQVSGASTFLNSTTIKNQADAEVDAFLWAGATAPQKESVIYKDWNGNSQWYMVKDASNNWALNSAVGGVDSFKAYQSNNSGDTYIDAANNIGVVRVNYEPGSGSAFNVYGGGSGNLYASFNGTTGIKFPGLAAGSGHNCVQIDNSGYLSNTGSACAGSSVGAGTTGQIAYYPGNGTTLAGMSTSGALASMGGLPLAGGTLSGPLAGTSADFSGNLQAAATVSGSVNGVLDLKAMFGASGSQQTMTCTATATSTALSSCSGGDFKSGQWAYIQGAGGLPTISAPAAPTLACAAVNGGSCTGSVVYGYKIVAVQSWPNGAVTAASTAATLTQAAQSPQAGVNSGRPYVYTLVSGYAVTAPTNSIVYVVYKSINGSPYTFYTYLMGSSFKDYGHMSGHGTFTCTDLGFPCTAPASPIPNDVFATITGSGASWTLSALPYPPKYAGYFGTFAPLNGSFYYPAVPATSGTFVVQHDDTPAFTTAWNYMTSNTGPFELHIPSGTFNLHNEDPYGGGGGVMHLNNLDNVVLSGNGDTSKLYQSGDRAGPTQGNFLIGGCGYNSQNPPGSCSTFGPAFGGGGTNYSVADPVPAGSTSFILTTPAQASNFPAGTYVVLGNNASGYPYEMYAELNLVTSSDATTGIVTLAYPTNKPYTATLPAPYSNCASCAAAPVVVPVLPRPVATHIKLRDFWYRGPNTFFGGNVIDYFDENNLTLTVTQVELQGTMRHRKVINNRVTEDPIGIGGSLIGEAAASSSDYEIKGNVYNGQSTISGQTCGEGATNIVWNANTFNFNGWEDNQYSSGPTGLLCGGAAVTFNYSWTGNTFNVSNGNLNQVVSSIDNSGNKCAFCTVAGNTFNIDTVGTGSPMASAALCLDGESGTSTAHIFNNDWNIGNGAPCAKQSQSSSDLPALSTYTTASQSGNIALYTYGQSQSALVVPMSGNITSVNIGDPRGRVGLYFVLGFQQPASGGPYTLPADCANSHWFVYAGGSGIDCPNGPPVPNPAAGSITYLWFLGDGTTLHFLSENYHVTQVTAVTGTSPIVSSGGATPAISINTCAAGVPGACAPDGTSITASGGVLSTAGSSSLVPKSSIDLTAQTANIGTTTAYAVPGGGAGMYLISCYTVVTTAATTSSTLPGCNVLFTDEDTGAAARNTYNSTAIPVVGSGAANVAGGIPVSGGGPTANSVVIRAAASSNIQYSTSAYASSGATAMQYALHFRVYYLGP